MIAWLAAAWLLASPARADSAPARPNIIMISLGNVGIRHMSAYGYGHPTTPWLAAFAKGAVLFDHAYSPSSWTLPVAASVFTGLPPRQHGLMNRYENNHLNPALPTLAQTLADAGYMTAAFTGGLDYDPVFGHLRGFQTIARNPNFEHIGFSTLEAQRWLKRRAKQPFFVFLHGYDAHCPFVPDHEFLGAIYGNHEPLRPVTCYRGYEEGISTGPLQVEFIPEWCRGLPSCPAVKRVTLEPGLQERLEQLYDETVLQEDAAVGRFLDSIPEDVMKNTIVVVYGDHGEMFAKHGRFGRNGVIRGVLYDDVIRVPLMIKAPGLAARRVSSPVELMDLARTILELAGERAPDALGGASLAAAARTGAAVRDRAHAGLLFYGWSENGSVVARSEVDAVTDTRWKLIEEEFYDASGRPTRRTRELYDVAADPEELQDLSAAQPEVATKLDGWLQSWRSAKPEAPGTVPIPDPVKRAARNFGYW